MPPSTRTYVAKVGTILLVLGCLSLTSCAPDERLSMAKPTPSSTPLFASEEEALEAARATYEGFLRTTETVLADGGKGVERIDEFAAASLAASEREGAQGFQDKNFRIEGNSSIVAFEMQRFSPEARGDRAVVVAYVCVDDSNIRIFNSDGEFDRPAGTVGQSTYEANFSLASGETNRLMLSTNEIWNGEGIC